MYIRDHHVPIIDRELWDKAQKELERRDVDSKVKEGHGNRYPLSGKIKCAECGATFVARYKKRNDSTKYKCWRCGTATAYGNKKIDKAGNEVGCDAGRQLREEIAMNILRQSVDSLLIDKTALINNITNIVTEVIHGSEDGEQLNVEKLEKQLKSISEKKKSVLDAFFSQSITKDEMRMMNEKYDVQITELTDKINATRKKQNLVYSCDDIKKDVEKKVSGIVNGKTATENFYGNLLRQITVFGDEKIEVELHFLPTKWQFIVESLKEIQKRTKTDEKPIDTGISEDAVHCEHDVLPENTDERTRMNTGFIEGGCHCEHDIPKSYPQCATGHIGKYGILCKTYIKKRRKMHMELLS